MSGMRANARRSTLSWDEDQDASSHQGVGGHGRAVHRVVAFDGQVGEDGEREPGGRVVGEGVVWVGVQSPILVVEDLGPAAPRRLCIGASGGTAAHGCAPTTLHGLAEGGELSPVSQRPSQSGQRSPTDSPSVSMRRASIGVPSAGHGSACSDARGAVSRRRGRAASDARGRCAGRTGHGRWDTRCAAVRAEGRERCGTTGALVGGGGHRQDGVGESVAGVYPRGAPDGDGCLWLNAPRRSRMVTSMVVGAERPEHGWKGAGRSPARTTLSVHHASAAISPLRRRVLTLRHRDRTAGS